MPDKGQVKRGRPHRGVSFGIECVRVCVETKEGHLCHLHQREQPVQRHGDLRTRLDSRLASWLCVVGFKQRTVCGGGPCLLLRLYSGTQQGWPLESGNREQRLLQQSRPGGFPIWAGLTAQLGVGGEGRQ